MECHPDIFYFMMLRFLSPVFICFPLKVDPCLKGVPRQGSKLKITKKCSSCKIGGKHAVV